MDWENCVQKFMLFVILLVLLGCSTAEKKIVYIDELKFSVIPRPIYKGDNWWQAGRQYTKSPAWFKISSEATYQSQRILAIEKATGCTVEQDSVQHPPGGAITYAKVKCDDPQS